MDVCKCAETNKQYSNNKQRQSIIMENITKELLYQIHVCRISMGCVENETKFQTQFFYCLGFQQFHALLSQELLYLLQFINITKANTHIAA